MQMPQCILEARWKICASKMVTQVKRKIFITLGWVNANTFQQIPHKTFNHTQK